MIRTANGTDNDNKADGWHFYTSNSRTNNIPRIE